MPKVDRNRNSKVREEQLSKHMKFASTSATHNMARATTTATQLSEDRLKTMLQDPSKNAVTVAQLSNSMKNVNGIYKRIIKYMSSILTYDHTIYPIFQNPAEAIKSIDDIKLAYANTALIVDRLNPKYNLPLFTEKLFVKGVTYQYKLEDSKGVTYQEFPTDYCRISYVEDGVFRFQFDISKVKEETVLYFPKEIQSIFVSGDKSKLVDDKWYQVSDKGVAFSLDPEALAQAGLSLPPLAHSLIDAIKIEKAKENMEGDSKLDNSKIVHAKIETDDRGIPLMDFDVVDIYHQTMKKALPEGAVALTNPFDLKGIALSGTGADGKFALLDKSTDLLYKGAGVSGQLFADDNSSSQALERSIQVDAQWLYSFILPLYANYYNYELKKAGKNVKWKIKFLPVSYFTQENAIKNAKEQLSFGGSRLEYLAYCGMTPIEVANVLIFEQQVLSIDDLMISKETSYTQSGDDSGRPKSDNPTDDTVRINDSK